MSQYEVVVISTCGEFEFSDVVTVEAVNHRDAGEKAAIACSRGDLEKAGEQRWLDCDGEIMLTASRADKVVSAATLLSNSDLESGESERAIARIQAALGQTDGGIAGQVFGEKQTEWANGGKRTRANILLEYLRLEIDAMADE